MANDNAENSLKEQFELINKNEERTSQANEELKKILKLNKLDRIELFDNSNLFGTYNVSGMVVFIDGKPAKNEYRKFKISVDKNDDYMTMREVIYRRYFRVLKDNLAKPDLIIVDGAKGQMNIAREVLKELNLDIMVVGLKKDDHHATNSLLAYDPIITIPIDKKSNLFYLLERMQDEVHNFTISYHRQLRSKGSLESILDNMNGIGKKRREELLKKYHTINNIKKQSVEELSKILPSKVAQDLLKFLENY
jgi:excinuclease ABC subunit C